MNKLFTYLSTRDIKNAHFQADSALNPPYQLHHSTHTEFDENSMRAQNSDFEFRKLDTAPFYRSALALVSQDVTITHSFYNCRLLIAGSNPAKQLTFGIPINPHARLWWHGKRVEGLSTLLIIPPNGELKAVIDQGFDLIGVSCSRDFLHEKADLLGLSRFAVNLDELGALSCDARKMSSLRKLLLQIVDSSRTSRLDIEEIRELISIQLVRLLAKPTSRKISLVSSSKKRQAIAGTERYILAHPYDAPKIHEICQEIGVSKRTLDYAFNESFGLTPKSYITTLRLNEVNKILRTRPPGSLGVSDAANAWGFWHMGQFAKDYRKLFGELPSQTLRN